MTKKDFANQMAENYNIKKTDALNIIDTFLNTLCDAFETGEGVKFVGFGSFEVRARDSRIGKNPLTGEDIQIEASKTIAFKCGKELKNLVNGK